MNRPRPQYFGKIKDYHNILRSVMGVVADLSQGMANSQIEP